MNGEERGREGERKRRPQRGEKSIKNHLCVHMICSAAAAVVAVAVAVTSLTSFLGAVPIIIPLINS